MLGAAHLHSFGASIGQRCLFQQDKERAKGPGRKGMRTVADGRAFPSLCWLLAPSPTWVGIYPFTALHISDRATQRNTALGILPRRVRRLADRPLLVAHARRRLRSAWEARPLRPPTSVTSTSQPVRPSAAAALGHGSARSSGAVLATPQPCCTRVDLQHPLSQVGLRAARWIGAPLLFARPATVRWSHGATVLQCYGATGFWKRIRSCAARATLATRPRFVSHRAGRPPYFPLL